MTIFYNLKEKLAKKSTKNILIIILSSFLIFLVTYRTLFPVNKNISLNSVKDGDLFLKNEELNLCVNSTGATVNNIFLKKHNYVFLNEKNSFESGWLTNNGEKNIPNRNTVWQLMENTNERIILKCNIKNQLFTKIFTLEKNKLIVEDKISTPSMNGIYSYGVFSLAKNYSPPINFISYNNKKTQLVTIPNASITPHQKQKVGDKDWFGIEDNFFLCFCNATNGNIFLRDGDNGQNCNQIFFLSNNMLENYKKYEIYIIPKDEESLNKYNIHSVLDYGWFSFITKPLSLLLTFFINKTNSGILGLILLAMIIMFLNLLLLFFIEKERVKMIIHRDEQTFIENNHSKDLDSQLAIFYKKYNIKIFRVFMIPMLMSFTWFLLNKAISLCFVLRGKSFLWISDLAAKDPYSILNLYGILNFNITSIPFATYLASDVLSIVATICFYIHTKNLQSKKSQDQGGNILQYIHLFFILSMCKSLSSGFIITFIFIFIFNYISSKLIQAYLLRKNYIIY
jgi:YidC/Oxa1 family membrane protein insertase